MQDKDEAKRLMEALAKPFSGAEVKFKPGAVSGNKALAMPYVDARVIQDRLDEVLGVDGWMDDYECRESGSVICRLRCKLASEWITKVDVGSPSEQPDDGDKLKAAFSDALKRAAVKFGVGRYLYREKAQWCDYEPQKRKFLTQPKLPGAPSVPEKSRQERAERPPPKPTANGAPPPPKDGTECRKRLEDLDAALAAKGVCAPGELMKFMLQKATENGWPCEVWPADIERWKPLDFENVRMATDLFRQLCKKRKAKV
jgi:hypothetical protein